MRTDDIIEKLGYMLAALDEEDSGIHVPRDWKQALERARRGLVNLRQLAAAQTDLIEKLQTALHRPQLGLGVIVFNRNHRVLVGRRGGSHAAGKWSFPGGKPEVGETLVDAARREVREESGLEITHVEVVGLANNWMPDAGVNGTQYCTIYLRALALHGEPQLLEPDRCEGWHWVDPGAIPQPHMTPLKNLRALCLDGEELSEAERTPDSLDFHLLFEDLRK